MKINQRLLVITLFTLYFVLTYKGIQFITHDYLAPTTLTLPGEPLIPFIPEMIFVYFGVYIIPPIIFFIPRRKGQLLKMVFTFFIASLIHYTFFLILPVHYELRPSLTPDSLLSTMILLFYQLDAPLNCFPSIHVSFAFISYYFVRRYKPEWANGFFMAACLVAASTILVKQHYIVDVLSAFFLSWGVNQLIIDKSWQGPLNPKKISPKQLAPRD